METFSALRAICAGNSPITGEFPEQRPVTRSFDGEAGDLRRHRAHYDVSVKERFSESHNINDRFIIPWCLVAENKRTKDSQQQLQYFEAQCAKHGRKISQFENSCWHSSEELNIEIRLQLDENIKPKLFQLDVYYCSLRQGYK